LRVESRSNGHARSQRDGVPEADGGADDAARSLRWCASTKTFRAGEALFRAGDRDPKFFVIKSGELEVIDITGDQAKTIRVQGPGVFEDEVKYVQWKLYPSFCHHDD
jgi:Cyclic nucleotide-binding domain